MTERRRVLGIVLAAAIAGACGGPERGVVSNYFGTLAQGDNQTLSSFATVRLEEQVDSWEIVGTSEEQLLPVTLPDLIKARNEAKAELDVNKEAANDYYDEHLDAVDPDPRAPQGRRAQDPAAPRNGRRGVEGIHRQGPRAEARPGRRRRRSQPRDRSDQALGWNRDRPRGAGRADPQPGRRPGAHDRRAAEELHDDAAALRPGWRKRPLALGGRRARPEVAGLSRRRSRARRNARPAACSRRRRKRP